MDRNDQKKSLFSIRNKKTNKKVMLGLTRFVHANLKKLIKSVKFADNLKKSLRPQHPGHSLFSTLYK